MKSKQIKVMAVTAILMAFNIVLSSFGVPVPGGHMYLNDVIICTAAVLLNPFGGRRGRRGGGSWLPWLCLFNNMSQGSRGRGWDDDDHWPPRGGQ